VVVGKVKVSDVDSVVVITCSVVVGEVVSMVVVPEVDSVI